jgi:hypothetical protein
LEEIEKSKWNKFVGIKWFVTEHLANKNYSISSSYILINILIDKNKIIKYDVLSFSGYNIVAIRSNAEIL